MSNPEQYPLDRPRGLECNLCGQTAQAHTPFGFMCERHAIREMVDAHERGEKDWVPFSLTPRPL